MRDMRRADRKSGGRKQRGRPCQQKRLDESPAQGGDGWVADVYHGQLDDVIDAYKKLMAPVIRQSAPPAGCMWRVERDATTITVATVDADDNVQMQVSGDYCDPGTGMWRDPRDVAERLAQIVLFGKVFKTVTAFKGSVKHG